MILALLAGGIVTLAAVAILLGVLIVGVAQTEDALRLWARRQRAGTQGTPRSNGTIDGGDGKRRG